MHSFCVRTLSPLMVACLFIGASLHAQSDTENSTNELSEPEERYFMITAYYSPVPGQRFYIQGSYEDDVRMNGEGKFGASGAAVRPGMIAAPSSLAFGTKIDIQGYGIGTVLDRGGAIVDSGENGNTLTRLDLWTGTGEEGLCRALRFGIVTAFGTIYRGESANNLQDSINLKELPASCEGLGFDLSTSPGTVSNYDEVFTYPVTQASSQESVILLKTLLQELGYLAGGVNGSFDTDLSGSIYAFQKAAGVVSSRDDLGAGYHGPKTRAALKAAYENGQVNTGAPTESTQSSIRAEVSVPTPTTEAGSLKPEVQPESQLFSTIINTAAQSDDIRELQGVLGSLGYFSYDPDGIYNKRLVDAIYDFQKSKDIVTSPTDVGAGYFGPKTRAALSESFSSYTANKQKIASLESRIRELEASSSAEREAFKNDISQQVNAWITPKIGSVDPDVRALQKVLIELGYMDHKDTAYFGPVSSESLAKFQLDKGLIDSIDGQYAGVFGTRTRAAIVDALVQKRFVPSGSHANTLTSLKSELAALQ